MIIFGVSPQRIENHCHLIEMKITLVTVATETLASWSVFETERLIHHPCPINELCHRQIRHFNLFLFSAPYKIEVRCAYCSAFFIRGVAVHIFILNQFGTWCAVKIDLHSEHISNPSFPRGSKRRFRTTMAFVIALSRSELPAKSWVNVKGSCLHLTGIFPGNNSVFHTHVGPLQIPYLKTCRPYSHRGHVALHLYPDGVTILRQNMN